MGRLIDVDEVKKRFPIMENDFGMVINERLHKELDKIPTVEAIPLSVIDEIKTEIEQRSYGIANDSVIRGMQYERAEILEIIDKYREVTE